LVNSEAITPRSPACPAAGGSTDGRTSETVIVAIV
jgi:hypothetical protein